MASAPPAENLDAEIGNLFRRIGEMANNNGQYQMTPVGPEPSVAPKKPHPQQRYDPSSYAYDDSRYGRWEESTQKKTSSYDHDTEERDRRRHHDHRHHHYRHRQQQHERDVRRNRDGDYDDDGDYDGDDNDGGARRPASTKSERPKATPTPAAKKPMGKMTKLLIALGAGLAVTFLLKSLGKRFFGARHPPSGASAKQKPGNPLTMAIKRLFAGKGNGHTAGHSGSTETVPYRDPLRHEGNAKEKKKNSPPRRKGKDEDDDNDNDDEEDEVKFYSSSEDEANDDDDDDVPEYDDDDNDDDEKERMTFAEKSTTTTRGKKKVGHKKE